MLTFQSDPLGLNAAPASGEGTGEASLGNGQRKRRPSEDTTSGGPNSFKRPKVSFFLMPHTGETECIFKRHSLKKNTHTQIVLFFPLILILMKLWSMSYMLLLEI